MDSKKLSIFSIIAASSCCLPPLILLGLTLVGIGTSGVVGVSSALGALKWYLLPSAIIGVCFSYWFYFREKRNCSNRSCKMKNEKLTRFMLIISTMAVFGFLAWSLYPYVFYDAAFPVSNDTSSESLAIYSIEGMTCGGCEIAVEGAIKATGLVDSVRSNFMDSKAYVWYQERPNLELIKKAVASVGYQVTAVEENEMVE